MRDREVSLEPIARAIESVMEDVRRMELEGEWEEMERARTVEVLEGLHGVVRGLCRHFGSPFVPPFFLRDER